MTQSGTENPEGKWTGHVTLEIRETSDGEYVVTEPGTEIAGRGKNKLVATEQYCQLLREHRDLS